MISVSIRRIDTKDLQSWLPLWVGYNAFYERRDATALANEITEMTWNRFFDPNEPVFALAAESEGELVGLAHYLFHRSTTRIEPTCYLQDLFTLQSERGRGIGRALIEKVYEAAALTGAKRVYWQTHRCAPDSQGKALPRLEGRPARTARHQGRVCGPGSSSLEVGKAHRVA